MRAMAQSQGVLTRAPVFERAPAAAPVALRGEPLIRRIVPRCGVPVEEPLDKSVMSAKKAGISDLKLL